MPLSCSELAKLKRMLESKTPTRKIIKELGCSIPTVTYHARKLGIKRPRGTAAMSAEDRARVARAGGQAISKDRKHMARLGSLGGSMVAEKQLSKKRAARATSGGR